MTHLKDFDNDFNKIELFVNDNESFVKVNDKEVYQSDAPGHELGAYAEFEIRRKSGRTW